ncbi:hypothetical protein [Zhenhengia yiwuensis]|uniref:Uncharacterized protein n=1 Tax=Zhenhengia yiwuensis TaxID=2763666 RepID=A0A926EIX3_9FIRM|nr:hypothetical protein [Zhenhengia yiwuensis]MBC8581098.1 hypothetical protein [Zhenhengia yiwuensis]
MSKRMTEIMMNKKNYQEAVQVLEFLEELEQEEKKELLVFLQGIRFAKSNK